MAKVDVRTGMPSVQLNEAEFKKRFLQEFYDPIFDKLKPELDKIADAAWNGYDEYRRSPAHVVKAGEKFKDPDYDLSQQWLDAYNAIQAAERHQRDKNSPSRILIVNGSSRSDQSCPGEMSKTWRLVELSRQIVERAQGFECEVLDLSRLTSEYGRVIHPCKACVSTAQPLCHWPCSCYPNHAIGQSRDWMSDLYPKWVAAHGIMIVVPGELVSGALLAQTDDRLPGLRRRRQSGSDVNARQRC